MRTVWPNTTVKIIGRFYDFNGNLVDPDTVTFTTRTPSGTQTSVTTPTVVKVAVGVYSLEYTVGVGGTYSYRIAGDNPDVTAEGTIRVETSAFT